VLCGVGGRRLRSNALARIISRCSERAGVEKHVTAHVRHTGATRLRQSTGGTRLVAEYLGHAGLHTVSPYAHVTAEEMYSAGQYLADRAGAELWSYRSQGTHPTA